MEETTAAVTSSPPATSNHPTDEQPIANSSKIREEGELSASENDDNARSRFPDGTILRAPPLNRGTSVIEKGVSAPIHNPAIALKTTTHSNKRKGTEKNRVPFVISFSDDDDSGSDSEEYKNMESGEMTRGTMDNRKFSTSMVQQRAKTTTKSPKKVPLTRTFVSSVNRVSGAKFKNGGNTFVGVKTHLKKSNPPSIIKFGQKAANIHVNSNKLQDLRQLIAIRENELKSKAGKPDKEVASSSKKKLGNFNEPVVVEPKEQEKKRLKVSEPPRNVVVSIGQHDRPSGSTIAAGQHGGPPESTVTAGGQQDRSFPESTAAAGAGATNFGQLGTSALENDGLKGKHDKEIIIMQQHIKELKNHDISNLPIGGSIISNSRQQNKITNLGESSAQLTANTDKTSPPRQAQGGLLTNSSFWNHFGATTGEMDIKSLFELEELQDKELDEAQEHRRKCEIEERNALKAYRKAQRDLAEANSRCSYLYHKRNLFSANLRSHVMEDSNMFWSNMSNIPNQLTDANVNSITNMSENDTPRHQVEEKTNDSNIMSAEDEQTSAFGIKTGDSSLDSRAEGICNEINNNNNNNNSVNVDNNEDSLLLEASLRSQLFARLGNRNSKKNESGQSMETMETATDEKEDGEIMEDSGNVPSSETEKDQIYDIGDIVMSEKDQCDVDYGSFLAEPILKSAFSHVKFTENTQIQTDDVANSVCGAGPTDSVSSSLLDLYIGEVGSYSNNLPINPFWPHCMFELRGKCNDHECQWQHVRDYSSKNIESNNNDRGSLCLAPPTYLVCLDSLKADSYPYKYLVAPTNEQRWKKSFSAFLVVSSSMLADLSSDESCLHGSETRIEVHGVWNRQSSYFRGQNVKEGQPDGHMDGIYQRLETAFLNFSKEVGNDNAHTKCLTVLARALEEHPTSVLLWIVYLHIFYSNQKSIGKDDMYRYAIENNDSSYELWLMFINSRETLNDRLLAYNTAISALCRHASTQNRDPQLDSHFILDLFLQMINCLCSSGQLNIAIQTLSGLLSSTTTPTDPHAPSLHHIRKSITDPDTLVLCLCSVYVLLYKKLPDSIVELFESRKELSAIEWRPVQLNDDEKQLAVNMLELVPDSSLLTKWFAVNHIRCTAVVKGLDSCKQLLEKYIRLHPCSELVLLSIRVNGVNSIESTFAKFEEAISQISQRVEESGIQCIWNQYAEYAHETGKPDLAKAIIDRWNGLTLTESDSVFGLLNLALYKNLQNDPHEARLAIERAFEVASGDDYAHCVKEHAAFLLKNGFLKPKARLEAFLNMVNRYLTDPRTSPPPEPLSRTFIKSIENPKIQKLVNNILSPISSDSTLLNQVLESCFGSCLLPFEKREKPNDVIDLAEALMEIRPANYELALSICKNQSSSNASVSFWASVQLIDSLFQAVPVAPEFVWVESAGLLKDVAGFRAILEGFHKRALSVYPFSLKLWKSYRELYDNENDNAVVEMAREKGINL